MNVRSFALLCLLAPLTCVRPVHAAQSYDNCSGTIASLPAVINSQGTWCMKQDLATAITSGAAITVNTNNVTIDCNDYKLGGLAAGAGTQAYGVLANTRTNVTVRHCNIRGFLIGLFFLGTGAGHVVEDNRFDGNTHVGMVVAGDGSVIRRNRITDTGGSTVTQDATAIDGEGNADILDNTVSGLAATTGSNADAYGIKAVSDPNGRIIGNGIAGLVHDGTGKVFGITMFGAGHLVLRDNDVSGDGSAGSVGISCYDSQGTAKDNVTTGFVTAINACSDGGGNYNNP